MQVVQQKHGTSCLTLLGVAIILLVCVDTRLTDSTAEIQSQISVLLIYYNKLLHFITCLYINYF